MCAALVRCRRHPSADRPLIDWDLILVMEPMTIVGAVLGGFVTKVLPGWSTNVLLFILLVFLSERLWKRALQTVQNETALSNATSRASLAASTGRDLEHQSVRRHQELYLQPPQRVHECCTAPMIPPTHIAPPNTMHAVCWAARKT